MNSMTGFGRARVIGKGETVTAHLSCINKRGAEISVSLPRELADTEGEFYDLLKKSFERGKLQLSIHFETSKKAGLSTLKTRFNELKKACKDLGVKFEPSSGLVVDLMRNGSCSMVDSEVLLKLGSAAAQKAIANCKVAQAQEGIRLKKDFLTRIATIEDLHSQAQKLSADTVNLQRERLMKNLAQAGLTIDSNDERVLKELALFADRVDIAEELTRIQSHLTSFKKLLNSKGSIGRQVEFTLQELLREWNTLGNKSPQVSLVQLALAAKNEIERMKEQAANVM